MDKDDWRIRGQAEYLLKARLRYKKFKSSLPKKLAPNDDPRKYSDHEHCDFCWHKFMENCDEMEDCSAEGYCTLDERIWICKDCFTDFQTYFKWVVVQEEL